MKMMKIFNIFWKVIVSVMLFLWLFDMQKDIFDNTHRITKLEKQEFNYVINTKTGEKVYAKKVKEEEK